MSELLYETSPRGMIHSVLPEVEECGEVADQVEAILAGEEESAEIKSRQILDTLSKESASVRARVLYALSRSDGMDKHYREKALELMEEVCKDLDEEEALYWRCEFYRGQLMQVKREAESIAIFDRVFNAEETAEPYIRCNAGNSLALHVCNSDLQGAVDILEEALEIEGVEELDKIMICNNLGLFKYAQKDTSAAIRLWSKGIEVDDSRAEARAMARLHFATSILRGHANVRSCINMLEKIVDDERVSSSLRETVRKIMPMHPDSYRLYKTNDAGHIVVYTEGPLRAGCNPLGGFHPDELFGPSA